MIDFFGGSDKQARLIEALAWLKPRFGKGVAISGYSKDYSGERECQAWSAEDLDSAIKELAITTPGLGFNGYTLEVYIDDPDDHMWFKLRFA